MITVQNDDYNEVPISLLIFCVCHEDFKLVEKYVLIFLLEKWTSFQRQQPKQTCIRKNIKNHNRRLILTSNSFVGFNASCRFVLRNISVNPPVSVNRLITKGMKHFKHFLIANLPGGGGKKLLNMSLSQARPTAGCIFFPLPDQAPKRLVASRLLSAPLKGYWVPFRALSRPQKGLLKAPPGSNLDDGRLHSCCRG